MLFAKDDVEDDGDDNAEDDARDNGKMEAEVLADPVNVTGQLPQEGNLRKEHEEQAKQNQDRSAQ